MHFEIHPPNLPTWTNPETGEEHETPWTVGWSMSGRIIVPPGTTPEDVEEMRPVLERMVFDTVSSLMREYGR